MSTKLSPLSAGILAALAASSATMKVALQLAFCHLFFNIMGILLFYPVPRMRQVVLGGARCLGRTTAKYRWFAIAYLICMFLLFPGFFFAASCAGQVGFIIAVSIVGGLMAFICVINCMQSSPKAQKFLPGVLRTWKFLPEWMRSLAPVDRLLKRCVEPLSRCCCQCCVHKCSCLNTDDDDTGGDSYLYSDDDSDTSFASSAPVSSLPSTVSSRANLMTHEKMSDANRIYKPKGPKYSPVSQSTGPKPNTLEVSVNIPDNRTRVENVNESVI